MEREHLVDHRESQPDRVEVQRLERRVVSEREQLLRGWLLLQRLPLPDTGGTLERHAGRSSRVPTRPARRSVDSTRCRVGTRTDASRSARPRSTRRPRPWSSDGTGTAGRSSRAPTRPDRSLPGLNGVACASANRCFAVGLTCPARPRRLWWSFERDALADRRHPRAPTLVVHGPGTAWRVRARTVASRSASTWPRITRRWWSIGTGRAGRSLPVPIARAPRPPS